MREYEIVYIFRTTHTDEEIRERLEQHHAKLTASEGAEVTALEHWGKRPLAYPIDRAESGYYVVARLTADAAALPEFERGLKLDPELLRYLIVLSEGEFPSREEVGEEAGTLESKDEDGTVDEAEVVDEEVAVSAEVREESEAADAPAPAEAESESPEATVEAGAGEAASEAVED